MNKTGLAVVTTLLAVATSASAAVLCGRLTRDGTFSSAVTVREQCKRKEVRLECLTLSPLTVGGAGHDHDHAAATTTSAPLVAA